jgi:asparagine synthase (glutamine-hydrolysing)
MCGICGTLYFDSQRRVEPTLLKRMAGMIRHRGPDGEGTHISGALGFGHRRLAIIDLDRGAQPMSNEDRTVWLIFNGEIYNYQELTRDLIAKGHKFATSSDTEALIHAYEEYGVGCLDRLQGMFAFALWDEKDRTLLLARDRVGIKPLYYYEDRDGIIFGSEIKTILADPRVSREMDPDSIDRFLTYLYLPGEKTLLKGIRKLEPGHYLQIKDGRTIARQYWDLTFGAIHHRPIEQASNELLGLLKQTVRGYMISDVPVGFLLSGGVDSTSLLSCAIGETDKRINTFTIGFAGDDFADERPYARLAAERFGTDHYETTISAKQFGDFLPKYVWHMEEPVCEPPAVALYYVSKLAAEHVKVVLSGEGGDEAFGGYQNYRNLLLLEQIKRAAGPLKPLLSELARGLALIPQFGRAQKYAPLIKPSPNQYYYSRVSTPFSYFNRSKDELYTSEFRQSLNSARPNEFIEALFARVKDADVLNQLLYVDTKTWLPDDLLVKADKITMANSLELRVPLLDHKVLEFAAGLPLNYKVNGLTTKRILKKTFEKHVPAEILNRRKTGFPVPYPRWLKQDLRAYVADVLLDRQAINRGYFRSGKVESLLSKFAKGAPLAKEVFSLLTLELWHRQFVDNFGSSQQRNIGTDSYLGGEILPAAVTS